jgi:hypothetical protein
LTLIQTYKKKIETELEDICSDILEIIKVKNNRKEKDLKNIKEERRKDKEKIKIVEKWICKGRKRSEKYAGIERKENS